MMRLNLYGVSNFQVKGDTISSYGKLLQIVLTAYLLQPL